MTLRKLVRMGAAAGALIFASQANAADLFNAGGSYKDGPAYFGVNWSGLYAGVNGGYGWSENTNYLSPAGGFGGGQIGYNFQRGNIVFGLEADFQGAGISDSNASDKSQMNWFGTVRGRIGYAFDRALVYGTGGLAYGNLENTSLSETQTGWVVGGGVECKLAPAWSVKAEYQYIDLDASSDVGPLGEGSSDRTRVQTFRVGVNYFVGGVYTPLK